MTKRPSYHDLLRPENDHGPEVLNMARFLWKPKPKAKRKAQGTTRYVLRWFTLTGQTLSLESGDRKFLQDIINAGFPGKIIPLPAMARKGVGK